MCSSRTTDWNVGMLRMSVTKAIKPRRSLALAMICDCLWKLKARFVQLRKMTAPRRKHLEEEKFCVYIHTHIYCKDPYLVSPLVYI